MFVYAAASLVLLIITITRLVMNSVSCVQRREHRSPALIRPQAMRPTRPTLAGLHIVRSVKQPFAPQRLVVAGEK